MTEKEKIAKKAAVAYFGFSSAASTFPKGTQVKVYDRFEINEKDLDYVANNIAPVINRAWNECIGTLSRTARMSILDFAAYIGIRNRAEIDFKKIEHWMKCIVNLYDDVVLVEILKNNTRKVLLVNTRITR
jgi:hypothetical protein